MWNLEVTWMTSNQITIALTKGRIEKDTVTLLEKAGDVYKRQLRDFKLYQTWDAEST